MGCPRYSAPPTAAPLRVMPRHRDSGCGGRRGADARLCPDTRRAPPPPLPGRHPDRSEEHTSELQSLMRNSYAVFCLKKKKKKKKKTEITKRHVRQRKKKSQ